MSKLREECETYRSMILDAKAHICTLMPIPADLSHIVHDYVLPDVSVIDAIERALYCCDELYFSSFNGRVSIYCRDCPMPGHDAGPSKYDYTVPKNTPLCGYVFSLYTIAHQGMDIVSSNDLTHKYLHKYAMSIYKWINAVAAQAGP